MSAASRRYRKVAYGKAKKTGLPLEGLQNVGVKWMQITRLRPPLYGYNLGKKRR